MQGESNQIIANIRYVENETAAKLRKEELRKPFRIIVTKSDVYIHYPLVYLGVSLKLCVAINFYMMFHTQYVNNNPSEYSVIKYSWLVRQVKCKDQPIWRTKGKDKSSCGHKTDFQGRYIKDSQVE